jgi:hypothetical protein
MCGVPISIGQELSWNPDGTITRRRNGGQRMVFVDSDSLDALFSGIERLMGTSIVSTVIESEARAIQRELREERRRPLNAIGRVASPERSIRKFAEKGKAMGYGEMKLTKFNIKSSYMFCELSMPYSLLLFCGDLKGLGEGVWNVSESVSCRRIGPGRYFVKSFEAPFDPAEPPSPRHESRPRKPGDIKYERCLVCEVPREVSHLKWDLETGTITSPEHGLRMVFIDPARLTSIFGELESRFGIAMPFAIVEAQRAYASERLSPWLEQMELEGMRRWLSVQGLGNLADFEAGRGGFRARVENPELPHLLVGTLLGLYEHAKGEQAFAEWTLTDADDLEVSVTRPAA